MSNEADVPSSTPMVTISYVPLFYPQWHFSELTTKWQKRRVYEALNRFIENQSEPEFGLGAAEACVWGWGEVKGVPHDAVPTMILPHSREIYKHIQWWSQDKPAEFFQFGLYHDPDQNWYHCALMPNLTKSWSRITFNVKETHPDIDIGPATIIFVPLSFSSKSSSVISTLLERGGALPQPGETIDIGLLDTALLNCQCGPGDSPYNPEDTYWLRDIPVVNADDYLKLEHDGERPRTTPIPPGMLWQCDGDHKIIGELRAV